MKYKVGDKVRIKSKERLQEMFGSNSLKRFSKGNLIVFDHEYCLGKKAIVKNIIPFDTLYGKVYYYSLDNYTRHFDDWMLEDEYVIKKHATQRRKFSKIGNVIY